MKRLLTGLLLAPLLAWVVLWGPDPVFLAVVAAVALICFHEYSALVAAYGVRLAGLPGYVAGLLVLLFPQEPFLLVVIVALLALLLTLGEDNLASGLPRAGALLVGVLYIFGSLRFAAALRVKSPHWLLFALALCWLGDTAAYYVGRVLGRHKMAPRISPAKSWEGAAASLMTSLAFGGLYLAWVVPRVPLIEALGLSLAANVAGQLGDLAESALKRGCGVKDSGNLLPGHGGWLDRVDANLFSVPTVYALLALLGRL
ncbi:MAG: CDP-archaeol synthase [Acidobacteria bacterium]|nr:CDP-archaeol synthase [Acidobacteriota bacterium]